MVRTSVARLLQGPLLTGRLALLGGLLAVALPTLIRFAVSGVVTGCEFTPYLPFVLLSAIFIGWWQAALVALVSVAILGGLFVDPTHLHTQACFLSGGGLFLASSAIIIGTMVGIRWLVQSVQRRIPDQSADGIIFSLERGEVFASWHGQGPPLRLGSKGRVRDMMEDFLAQVRLGERLTGEKD